MGSPLSRVEITDEACATSTGAAAASRGPRGRPLRVGLMFDTTLMAARMIYAGIFERYPNFPFVLAHSGAALIMLLERLDNGYRLFPDCRKYINRLPSDYASRLYYDTCAFGQAALVFVIGAVGFRASTMPR